MKHFILKSGKILHGIFTSSISHPHKATGEGDSIAWQKDVGPGDKRTINHHLENFHHVSLSWFLASLIGIYAFLGASLFRDTLYAASVSSSSLLPPQVTGVTGYPSASTSTTGSVSLSWSASISPSTLYPVFDYIIKYKPSTTSSYSTYSDGRNTSTKTEVKSLLGGKSYDFIVAARNRKGVGKYSTPVRITLQMSDVKVPDAPKDVTAVAGTGEAKIVFLSPENIVGAPTTSFTIISSPENKVKNITFSGGILGVTQYHAIFPDLTNGVTYTFTLKANNSQGSSLPSIPSNPVTPLSQTGTSAINGQCGTLNNTKTASYPVGSQACSTGIQSNIDSTASDGTFNWACLGANGGTNATCTAEKISQTNALNILDFGAKADGVTNNLTAIKNSIAAAKSQGKSVFVPEGTFAYSGVIQLDGVKIFGAGDASVLYAQNWDRESIFIYGNGAGVSSLKLTGVLAPSRQAHWEATHITLFGATNFVIENVTIEGSAAAGIQTARAASGGLIKNNRVRNTLSDGIHLTDRASNIVVEGNTVESTGDDGIAVVSYQSDGGYVSNIIARNNTVRNNKWGRLMSVVGGKNVLYENNYLDTNLAGWACMYIAQEASYATYGAHDVTVRYNTMKNCGTPTNHGIVMIYSDGYEPNTNITFMRNDIIQNGQIGMRVFNDNRNVILDSNRVSGAIPDYSILTSSNQVVLKKYESGPVGKQ